MLTQRDDYNCGAFALDFLWCAASAIDLSDIFCVGDHLRLGILLTVIRRGYLYDAVRAQRATVR